jgi:hypothetical protein
VAEDSATPPEAAASYRGKAETLILKYRLDAEEVYAKSTNLNFSTPIEREMVMCDYMSDYSDTYLNIMWYVVLHVGGRMVTTTRRTTEGKVEYLAKVTGFEVDLRFAEIIYTAAFLAFQAHTEPTDDPAVDAETNTIFRLRHTGRMTRGQIAVYLWGKESSAGNGKVQKVYEREATRRGVPFVSGRGVNRGEFLGVYSDAFVNEFYWRLAAARQAANKATGNGPEMVLAGRQERVDEAFYVNHPRMRPQPVRLGSDEAYVDTRSEAEKKAAERLARKSRLAEAKLRNSPAGQAGWKAGREAAASVDLGGIKTSGRIGND